MIQKLTIQNFQSHAKTELEFSTGVNVIVGSTDSGKTAIIRALRWLIWNRPSGDSIRSNRGGDTSVKLQTDEDIIITRFKGKTDSYISHVTGEEDVEFKAFGTSVPEEIINLLNINEINIQQQLDSPFLLTETPGAVASHFNKVAKLDKIDSSLQKVNSFIRELTSEIKYKEEQEVKQIEGLKKFEHLEKFEIEVEVLEGMENQFKQLDKNADKLQGLINDIELINSDIKDKSKIIVVEKPLNQILDWIDDKNELIESKRQLDRLWIKINTNIQEIEDQQELLSIEKPVLNLLKQYEDLNMAVEARKRLNKALC